MSKPERHRLPWCGDPDCTSRWHRLVGWFMPRRPYPWDEPQKWEAP